MGSRSAIAVPWRSGEVQKENNDSARVFNIVFDSAIYTSDSNPTGSGPTTILILNAGLVELGSVSV
jgi:hypothetical protein